MLPERTPGCKVSCLDMLCSVPGAPISKHHSNTSEQHSTDRRPSPMNKLPPLTRTLDLLERGRIYGTHLGGQVYVSLPADDGGRMAHDVVFGERSLGQEMTDDTLMSWLSSGKPLTAVCIARLWERGALQLDDPVMKHIPEFEAHGKSGITLRHLLTHTGGIRLPTVGWPAASWDEIIANICKARPEPRWRPGYKAGYHMWSSWFVLGEVIRRVDGRPYSEFVRAEVCEPLGMDHTWVGMPKERFEAYGERLGAMFNTEKRDDGKPPAPRTWHHERSAVSCSPGSSTCGPLRELGRFYEVLLAGGRYGDYELLRPQTIEALTARHRVGLLDATFRHVLDWGLGFIPKTLHPVRHDGTAADAEHPEPYGYGRHASPRTVGRSGFQSSTGLMDPEHGLVIAMAVNGNPGEPAHTLRFRALTEALYEDLGLAEGE